MSSVWQTAVWQQFGAAIDMLENAITTCPAQLWGDRPDWGEFWVLAYHTLFWLDLYLAESPEGFAPPAPFGLEELDPAGVLPPRVYSKQELLTYLEHGRRKCRARLAAMTDQAAQRPYRFHTMELMTGELMLYNMRHVQHGAAQLNLMLRQRGTTPPRWVRKAELALDAG